MISVTCPSCKIVHKADESLLGKRVKCKDCGAAFEIVSNDPQSVRQPNVGDVDHMVGAALDGAINTCVPCKTNVTTPAAIWRYIMKLSPALLSSIAIVISMAAIVLVLVRPSALPGKGLSSYDFSTPQRAIQSKFETEANGDLRAVIELDMAREKADGEKIRKRLASLKLEKTIEFEEKGKAKE